ncbi:MAG TPA: Na+/galactose cotransporter, partial [Patescibacteria group bacterium]|nr:Na+/galactose cotransporter [Patescibacteria group bacterium]
FMIVLGFAPVVYLGLRDVGGWTSMNHSLQTVAQDPVAYNLGTKAYAADAWTSAWKPLLGGPSANPMGVDLFAMVFGLGFVLSFGYWCTNFLVVQRAMAAKNMSAARRTPLIAAVPKMIFPILVIVPGMIAVALTSMPQKNYRIPPPIVSDQDYTSAINAVKRAGASEPAAAVKAVSTALGKKVNEEKVTALVKQAGNLSDTQIRDGLYNAIAEYDYDGVILSLVKKYCPTGLLGLALTALLASFMSGMAGNVTAFNTVWTYDLYQAYLAPNKSDQHYFRMGQAITVVGILLSIACAYFASKYNNAMDIIQLVFGFVNAPLFATFLLGMFWSRTTGTGAFLGLFGGIASSALFHSLTIAGANLPGVKGGYLHVVKTFPSEMAQNFWLASFAFTVCFTLTLVISLATARTKTDEELKGLVYSLTPRIKTEEKEWYLRPSVVGIVLLLCCVVLNIIFR